MRRVAAALAIVAGVGLVALTGHGSGDDSAQAAVRRAAARAADAGSSRFTMRWTAPELPEQLGERMTIEGVMDYVNHRGRVSYWGDNQVIFDGDIVYMRWPLPWRDVAPWVRFEDKSSHDDPLDLQERAMRNPIGLLEFLTGASSNTRNAGAETLRATPTTHYEGTLDLQLVVDRVPAGKREELQDWLNFIGEHEPTKVPFGIWVDGEGLTHRLRIDGQDASVTIEYFDFGVPVKITVPPESEIISNEEFWNEAERHADDQTCSENAVDEADLPSVDSSSTAETETRHLGDAVGDVTTTSNQAPSIRLCPRLSDEED